MKLKVLNSNKETKNLNKTSCFFGISRETYYQWKRAYEKYGESGLVNSKPCPENSKIRIPQPIEEKFFIYEKTII